SFSLHRRYPDGTKAISAAAVAFPILYFPTIEQFSRMGSYGTGPVIVCADFIPTFTGLLAGEVARSAPSHLFIAGRCISPPSLAFQLSREICSALVSRARGVGRSHGFRHLCTNQSHLEFSFGDIDYQDFCRCILHRPYHSESRAIFHAFLPRLLWINMFVTTLRHSSKRLSEE